MHPAPASHDPQLARALAAITLPSFEELAALTGLQARLAATAPTPALVAATVDQNDWQRLRGAA